MKSCSRTYLLLSGVFLQTRRVSGDRPYYNPVFPSQVSTTSCGWIGRMLRCLRSRLSAMWSTRPPAPNVRVVDRQSGLPIEDEVLTTFRQGDIFDVYSLPVHWTCPGVISCPEGVVAVSQTCDLIKLGTAEVQVSPVVRLAEPEAGAARSGRQPRYALLPRLGPNYFADLSVVTTIHKSLLLTSFREHGLDGSNLTSVRSHHSLARSRAGSTGSHFRTRLCLG
jgi:hypothetical protein